MGEQVAPVVANTICPTCDGSGAVIVARAVASERQPTYVGTAHVEQVCPTCKGSGRLKGFQAPV